MKKVENDTIKVVELFAGVGGFRLGLESASKQFKTVWANQWEPSTKTQYAVNTYKYSFFAKDKKKFNSKEIKNVFSDEDIFNITGRTTRDTGRLNEIPKHDLIVGGFPCQDYSVARPLSHSAGLEGKKGVLWWSIYNILHNNWINKKPTPYLFLENVDRLLKSPANNRGRDFSIILSSLSEMGYVTEWRVINAAEYGFPQKRRRTFIVAYHRTTELGKLAVKKLIKENSFHDWTIKNGILADAFPVNDTLLSGSFTIAQDPTVITSNFNIEASTGNIKQNDPYMNSGVMIDLRVYTAKVTPKFNGNNTTLGDIVSKTNEEEVDEKYYIKPERLDAWKSQKCAHAYERTSKDGHSYMYKEGALPFPDKWDSPSRTIITSEGGATPTRIKHVVDITNKKGYEKGRKIGNITYKYRRLTPEELESLCMFPPEHTKYMIDDNDTLLETPDTKRAFFMGNALVVGAIEKVGKSLIKHINKK